MKRERTEAQARYAEYLASRDWHARRAVILERDDYTCPCGSPAEHVHHLTYGRVGQEFMSDLMAVCSPCHKKIHKLGGSIRKATIKVLGRDALPVKCHRLVARPRRGGAYPPSPTPRPPKAQLSKRQQKLLRKQIPAKPRTDFSPFRPPVGGGVPQKVIRDDGTTWHHTEASPNAIVSEAAKKALERQQRKTERERVAATSTPAGGPGGSSGSSRSLSPA